MSTGELRLDDQSLRGKMVGLVRLAGSVADALARPEHWLRLAPRDVAASRARPTPSRAR